MTVRYLSLTVAVLSCFSMAALAQTTRSQITGRISDPTGVVAPDADVSVVHEATGIKRDTKSNELGYYNVPLLPPGNFRVTVQRAGFRPVTRSGITLAVDQVASIDFVLEIGAVSESVQVTANVSKVDTHTVTLKEVVDQRRIRELPLNGRDASQLILLLPGIYGTNDTSGLRQAALGAGCPI